VPAVGEAFIIAPAGRRLIHTYGMRALSAALTKVTYDDVHLVYAAAIREAAQPIADTANRLAPKATGARWGMPSRSAFPAIEQHLPEVAVSTSQAVTEMYNALCSRDWSGYPDP